MQIPSIQPLVSNSIQGISPTNGAAGANKVDAGDNAFGKLLDSLNQSQNTSDTLVQQLATGQDVDLHQVIIASQENDVNFRVAMAIRDRLVDAYREVMRMNV
jgi:flagellar hook-basal body complex protein FliE